MLAGIACAWSSLPLELLELPDIARRAYERGGEREVQFLYRDRVPLLPFWHEGKLQLACWGTVGVKAGSCQRMAGPGGAASRRAH